MGCATRDHPPCTYHRGDHDQQGVLAGVSSAIAACNGNISRASVITSQDKKAYLEFTVDIRDITHLNEIIHRVENLRGVLSVERVKNTPRWGKWHLERSGCLSALCRSANNAYKS